MNEGPLGVVRMHEYDIWYEVWEDDGFGWGFVADFDTREEAEALAARWPFETRIKKGRGLA